MSHNSPRRLALVAIALSALSGLAALPAAGQVINEITKLLPADGAAFAEFGFPVAISGTTAVVGARNDNNSGSAYLFDTATGQQLFKLLPSDGASLDSFGNSVAISGTTAVVGAFQDDDNGPNSGSAYLFDTTTGQQLFKLLPSDGEASDLFGNSVAISGTTAVVGARLDDDNGPNSGSVYLFDTTTGQQLFKLLPSDGAVFDEFGGSVAISGTAVVVGAFQDDDNGTDSGSAYVFDTTTGQQIAKLVAGDGGAGDRFGISVAISGTTAVVGAFQSDDNGPGSGSAYLFDLTTGNQIAKLLPSDGAASELFGISVAISGTTAVVGAFGDDANGSFSGSAYLFGTATGDQISKLLPADGAENDNFGISVAISGSTVVVGAWKDDDNGEDSGSAYVFDPFADTDGDGLLDDWEINGIPYTDGDGVAQRLMLSEADPRHKDLYVEIDSMVGRGFDEVAQLNVITAFANAPNALVNNPDGRDGITLHLIVDEVDLPLVPFPNTWADFDVFKASHFGTPAEHGNAPLLAAKAKAYRYCVFGQSYGTTDSSGLAELPGNDFMVTLGLWNPPGGTVDQQAGTFMHEFGHTLGLRHGGGNDTHFKPNYYSVMNYRWQTPQTNYAELWRLDYSREALPPLVESALDESISLGATLPEYAAVLVPFTTAADTFEWAPLSTGGTVDWNGDGATPAGQPLVMADINRRNATDAPGDITTLASHNDWANLRYALGGHPNFGEGRTETTIDDEFDLTEFAINEQIPPPPAACLADFNGDGTLNFFDVSAFLTAFAANAPSADFNADGVFNFFDVSAYLAAFSAGCP